MEKMNKLKQFTKQALICLLTFVFVLGITATGQGGAASVGESIVSASALAAAPISESTVNSASVNATALASGKFVPADTLIYSNLALSPGSNEREILFAWRSPSAVGGIAIAARDDGNSGSDNDYRVVTSKVTSRSTHNIHKAKISGLAHATTYNYVLLGENNTASAILTITTGSPDSFSFFAVADIQIGGSGSISKDTESWINTLNIAAANFPEARFIISAGDQTDVGSRQSDYDGLLRPAQLSALPLSPSVGNHDSGSQLYPDHFYLPHAIYYSTGATNFDYWYLYGNALFIVLNSNNTSMSQYREIYIRNIINKNPEATWKIVLFHQGPYSEFRVDKESYKINIINNWIPLFESVGVDVVISGHDHAYTRTYQMLGNAPQKNQSWLDAAGNPQKDESGLLYNTVLNPAGIVYFTLNSASGSKYYSIRYTPRYFSAKNSQNNRPSFSVAEVTGDSFSLAAYQVNADGTISEIDAYTIIKP